MQQIENWDNYRRQQVNIEKAVTNPIVSKLLQQHYNYLYPELVKSDLDQEIFNDTFLKLTYNYDPKKEFTEQYRYYFHLLKGAYYRDKKYFVQIDNDNFEDVQEETTNTNSNANFIETFKTEIQNI